MSKKPKATDDSHKSFDMSEGYDNMSTRQQIGMFFIPKVAVVQKPEIVMHVMKYVIPTAINVYGKLGDYIIYTAISEAFIPTLPEDERGNMYDVAVTHDGEVSFKLTTEQPKFSVLTKEDFDEAESQDTVGD